MEIAIALAVCQVVWGGYSVVGKWVVAQDVDPLVFAFVRDLLASPVLLLLAWAIEARRQRPWRRLAVAAAAAAAAENGDAVVPAAVPKQLVRTVANGAPLAEDRWMFVLLGALMCGNQVGYILGVALTTPTNAALIQPTVPVLTACLSAALGIEHINLHTRQGWLRIVGIVAVVMGAFTVVTTTHPVAASLGRSVLLGNAFLLGNCLCDAFYVLVQKRLTGFPSPSKK